MTGKKRVDQICIKRAGKLLTMSGKQFAKLYFAQDKICCADARDSTWVFTQEGLLPFRVKRSWPGLGSLSKKPWNYITMPLSEFKTLLAKTEQAVVSVSTALRKRRAQRKNRKAAYAENFVTHIPSGEQYTKTDYILWAAAPSVVYSMYCRSVWSISFCLVKCANVCPSREDHIRRFSELSREEILNYARDEYTECILKNTWHTLSKLKPHFTSLIARSQVRATVTQNWNLLKERALEYFEFVNHLRTEEDDIPDLMQIVQQHTKTLSFNCKCSIK